MSGGLAAAARRGAGLLPEPLVERTRLLEARRLQVGLRRSAAVRGAALVLHGVAPSAGDPLLELDPPVAAERLDEIAGHLAANYRVVRAAELASAARERPAGERVPVAITFDDDLVSHHEFAAPILRRHGLVATAFLCGRETPFWWQLLQLAVDEQAIDAAALAPLLAAELVEPALRRRPRAIARLGQVIEQLSPAQREDVAARLANVVQAPRLLAADGRAQLAAGGWEIGFHTRRHDLLTTLGDDALHAALEPAAADGARTLAYPHGKASEREARVAREAGYVAAYTGRAEVFDERTDEHLIGRLQPHTATLGGFALQLARALSAR